MFSLLPWSKKKPERRSNTYKEEYPLTQMRDDFDRLFDRFWGNWPALWQPAEEWQRAGGFEIEEKDNELLVKAEVPGFEPNEVDVQLSGQMLTISAEKKESKEDGGGRQEVHRSFRRSVMLPPGTDANKIEARCRHGLLEVHVPRSEEFKGKRIPIRA